METVQATHVGGVYAPITISHGDSQDAEDQENMVLQLPADLRDRLRLKPGDQVEYWVNPMGHLSFSPVSQPEKTE